MYLKHKTISCLATLTACLLVGHSSTAHATPPKGTRERHVQKVEIAHPSETLGYLSKPIDEKAYTGEQLDGDIVSGTIDNAYDDKNPEPQKTTLCFVMNGENVSHIAIDGGTPFAITVSDSIKTS